MLILLVLGVTGDVGYGGDVPRCHSRCFAHQCCEKISILELSGKPGGGHRPVSVQSKGSGI